MSSARSVLAILLFLHAPAVPAQDYSRFNVTLSLDFSSAESMIELCKGEEGNVQKVAALRGNRIAAATSALLARKPFDAGTFVQELQLLRGNFRIENDDFGLEETRRFLPSIDSLLQEAERHQIDRRVVSTIEQFFPPDLAVNADIPVYFVAMGHENAAAYVRRVVWHGDIPEFVGEGEGELVIVVNLTRSVQYLRQVQAQLIDMMSTLAHETFHAVFGVYQNTSPVWQAINAHTEPAWALGELVQNEGIAYYLSMQQRIGPSLSPYVLAEAKKSVAVLNSAFDELFSPATPPGRIRELILNANLSGSLEKNYGATAGLLMAYAIDAKLGRPALAATIVNGIGDFFEKYNRVVSEGYDVPQISPSVVSAFSR